MVLLACSAISNVQALAEPMPDAVERKVARLELARSIRAFAAGTLANGTCLIDKGALNRQQADAAMNLHSGDWGSIPPFLAFRRCGMHQSCSNPSSTSIGD